MLSVTRMVQISGRTYRIGRLGAGMYEVVRIADDLPLGVFCAGPPLQVSADPSHEPLVRQIARAAIRQAKTSWLELPAMTET